VTIDDDIPTRVVRVSQRERQAATAFRCGESIIEIAACLGVSASDAEAWLDSDRLAEVCQAMRTKDRPRRGRPRKEHKS
jgi:transposase